MQDVEAEIVSDWSARHIYKVAYDPDTMRLDLAETQTLRDAERKARLAKLASLKRKQPGSDATVGNAEKPVDTETAAPATNAYISGRNYDVTTRGPRLGFESAPNEKIPLPSGNTLLPRDREPCSAKTWVGSMCPNALVGANELDISAAVVVAANMASFALLYMYCAGSELATLLVLARIFCARG